MKLSDRIKNFNIQNCRISVNSTLAKLQTSTVALVAVVFSSILFMILIAFSVFMITVKGSEQVMVPAVEGKELTQALIEMQAKELYPKIQLKYSDDPSDAGKILSQSPISGSIIKAGSRVTLVVSRGVIIDHIEDFVGQKIDDVKIRLQTLFTGNSRALIVLGDPVYKADNAEAGTILAQDPEPGTYITNPVTVTLVISRGPEYEHTRVPDLRGLSVQDLLKQMSNLKVVLDITAKDASKGEKDAFVSGEDAAIGEFVDNYSRVNIELSLPKKSKDGLVYGVISEKLANYPYPVTMSVDVLPKEGNRYNLVTLQHTGGNFTVPYAVPKDSELVLSVAGKEIKHISLN